METLKAKSCAVNKCEMHYQYLTDSPFWKKKMIKQFVAQDTSSYSVIEEYQLRSIPDTAYKYRFALCDDSNKCVKIIENFYNSYISASKTNRTLYIGAKEQAS